MERHGRFFEDYTVGERIQHWPGRTIRDADDTWFTLLTMNSNPLHFDEHYASQPPHRAATATKSSRTPPGRRCPPAAEALRRRPEATSRSPPLRSRFSLQRLGAALAGANSHDLVDRAHEDLPVPDAPGPRALLDRL